MDTKTQHGYLVLADISGFTSYLAGVELEHAHEILTELLELIVERFQSVLTISKLEGDAVFAYAPLAKVPRGETLLELIEATYVTFRDRVEAIRRRTTCECNACSALPKLDLKFLAHHGSYIVQNVAGLNELVGTDVNMVHRLLKNHVGEATGWRAYALFTEAVLDHIGVRPERMNPQTETYDLGAIQTHSLNLHPRYAELTAARRVIVAPEEAHRSLVVECDAPPPVLWEWLNDPRRRVQWEKHDMQPAVRPAGRTAPGARNHCMHGKNVSLIETVLDWRPFEYFTVEKDTRMGGMVFAQTFCLEPLPGGNRTRLSIFVKFKMPLPRLLLGPACRFTMGLFGIEQSFRDLVRLVGEEAAREQSAMLSPAIG